MTLYKIAGHDEIRPVLTWTEEVTAGKFQVTEGNQVLK